MTTPEQNRTHNALIAALRMLMRPDPVTGRVDLNLTSSQLDEAHDWELSFIATTDGFIVRVDGKQIPLKNVNAMIRKTQALAWSEGRRSDTDMNPYRALEDD